MKRTRTILYVEDDAVTLTAYQNRLHQAGFSVEPAFDGLQALGYLQRFEPDLILLDLVLPKFDGEDVLKYIYATPRLCHVPVIILSSSNAAAVANVPLVQKAGQHLRKQDCTFATLLQTIERVLMVVEATKPQRAPNGRPRACAVETPRVLSFLQLNLRGADPAAPGRATAELPVATA